MPNLPVKVATRIAAGIKRFQPILASAKSRDVNESDTVVIVADILHEVLGYDKYSEITSEHAVRGTYCDLAIKLDGTLALLAEVKAIGIELKESHVKQGIDYAANQGTEWVLLTNGATWRAYKVGFGKPLSYDLVLELNFLELSARADADIEMLFLLSKEGWQRSKISEYQTQQEALSRFSIAAILLSDPVIELVRREIRRLSPGVRVEADAIRAALESDVLKRDTIEGDRAVLAKRLVARAASKALRQARGADTPAIPPSSRGEQQIVS